VTALMDAAAGVGDAWPGLRQPRLVDPAPAVCTPLARFHRLSAQAAHVHITAEERRACEWEHAELMARLLLAGEVEE